MKYIMSMIKNFFRGCRYFCLGIKEMNRQKRTKTFTKQFPAIGEMTGKGVSINKCKGWFTTLPHYLCWDNVRVSITERWTDDKDLEAFATLFRMMNNHADEILATVKEQIKDPDILKNVDQVEMELHNFDLDGKTKHPYVCLNYNTERFYTTIFIEDDGKSVMVELSSNV